MKKWNILRRKIRENFNVGFVLFLVGIFFCLSNGYTQSNDFVSLKGRKFKLAGQDYYPLSLNYIVDIVHDNQGDYYVAPHHSYFLSNHFECLDEQDCFDALVDDFVTIRNLGFNSIRLVGLGFGSTDDLNENPTSYPAFRSKDNNNNILINPISSDYQEMFYFTQRVLDAASAANIRVQLLVGGGRVDSPLFRTKYQNYLSAISANFSSNSTLYSYDLLNEPLYFDNDEYSKRDVCNLVEGWYNALKVNSSRHLVTLGLATSSEVFEWDPGVLKLDFLSFHLYSDIIDVVKSEIKWISETSRLPWMIGETGFGANANGPGGQGTVSQQRQFAKETMEMTRDCGGSGYSWWMYKDVYWGDPYMGDFFGVLDHQNVAKPVSVEFGVFNPNINTGGCITPSNYYNMNANSAYSISGIVRDQNNQPIKNAVITCWAANWKRAAKTFSKLDGSFTLYSDSLINIVYATTAGGSVYKNYNASGFLNINISQHSFTDAISVNNVVIGSSQQVNYESSDWIRVENTTITGGTNGGMSSMKAVNLVELKSGFEAKKGSWFHAYNAPVYLDCDNNVQSYSNKKALFADKKRSDYAYLDNTEIHERTGLDSIYVFPNPSKTGVYNVLSDSEMIDKVEVYGLLGTRLFQYDKVASTNVLVDISKYSKGSYLLKVYKGEFIRQIHIIYD